MTTTLQLETEDFRIEGELPDDVWEVDGKQYFTWEAAMRETEKQGKRMPTKDEWKLLCPTVEDVEKWGLKKNGYRGYSTAGYNDQGTDGYYWSSSPVSPYAYYVVISSANGVYPLDYINRANGFSVRCLKNQSDSLDSLSLCKHEYKAYKNSIFCKNCGDIKTLTNK